MAAVVSATSALRLAFVGGSDVSALADRDLDGGAGVTC